MCIRSKGPEPARLQSWFPIYRQLTRPVLPGVGYVPSQLFSSEQETRRKDRAEDRRERSRMQGEPGRRPPGRLALFAVGAALAGLRLRSNLGASVGTRTDASSPRSLARTGRTRRRRRTRFPIRTWRSAPQFSRAAPLSRRLASLSSGRLYRRKENSHLGKTSGGYLGVTVVVMF